MDWFAKQKFEHKLLIAGNHDFYFEKAKAKELEQVIPKEVTYLLDNSVEINGIKIWGSPFTPWFHNWAFNATRGKALARHWNKIPEGTDIIMTHGPAYGMLDTVINGNHVGCVDLWKRIEVLKPKVHICGHVHESFGKKERNGTKFINASQVNEEYILVNKPLTFEL